MCKNKITSLGWNWIREIVNPLFMAYVQCLELLIMINRFHLWRHHILSCALRQEFYASFSVLRPFQHLSCCGCFAGGGEEHALYYLPLRKKSDSVITERSHWIEGGWPWLFWSLSQIHVAPRLAVPFAVRFSAEDSARISVLHITSVTLFCYVFIFMAYQPLVGQDLLIAEALRSHSDTPNSLGLLWTRNRPVAETSTR